MTAATPDPPREPASDWDDQVRKLLATTTAAGADELADRWLPRLPAAYRGAIRPSEAVDDLRELELLGDGASGLRIRFSGERDADGRVFLSAYARHRDLELSRFLPILESLGLWVFDELHWSLGDEWHVYDFRVRDATGAPIDRTADGPRLCEAALAVWEGRATADGLNRLVTRAGMTWPEVEVLRAVVRYRRQVDPRYTLAYTYDVLVAQPDVAHGLVELFEARLSPTAAEPGQARAIHDALVAACDAVVRLDADRILRGLIGTVEAVVRTNRWTRPEGPLAIKLDSARIPDVVAPVPYREIWVHGPNVQGIHLRAGPVARGGLRWSDRVQDLRTEVLDLMRTQVLKNALVVPTGAKGGFVLAGDAALLEPGPAQHDAVRAAYVDLVTGLLDLTDDRHGGEVVGVPGRLDGDDTYLVVAADRGTATFSDLANELSLARGYWLGDAFASGGSNGYDHKALGVTARGAWTAVAHHFAEVGVDVDQEPISVVGIGDMSGDVFGNGMLRSPHIQLVAAFDHRHVFVDPDADPAASFAERRRLFDRPGSSWDDYDRSLVSAGGGVFSRQLKSIELTRQMRDVLRVSDERMTPAELIRAILRAPVDLLFAGGVGTFVRASSEDDRGIDDRVNSELRVEASTLRARVVGEGANLAFTQRARIEYARRGGRINMDAIDNSAGVDTSDSEVNLKILLDLAVEAGDIDSPQRDRLLRAHTEDVVHEVLHRTARQCERLSISQAASAVHPAWFERVLAELVADGVLDPEVEALPSPAELDARRAVGAGLTRPELAVVMAGVKRWLSEQLLDSDLPDQPGAEFALAGSFPEAFAQRFADLLSQHPLRRELTVSAIVNDVVDWLGITFVHRIAHDTGASAAEVVAAAGVARGVIDAPSMWGSLGRVTGGATDDPSTPDPRVLVVDLLDALTRSELARRGPGGIDVAARVAEDRDVFVALLDHMGSMGTRPQKQRRAERLGPLLEAGLDHDVATWAVLLPDLRITPDVAELSRTLHRPPVDIAAAFIELDRVLGIDQLADLVGGLNLEGRWRQAAQKGLLEDIADLTRVAISRAVTDEHESPVEAVQRFLGERADAVADATRFRQEVEQDPASSLDGLAVAVRAVRRVVMETRAPSTS
ncbi:MAG: NAD-glutamate dehydrogenase [Acidimicrobiales bacterium]|nr:NAD-glutamate dehydrogenase [Acidimicrobiales bacterium]